ncbi:uncharacterized protein MELLADRAFT_59908 [Melampsora larici-populina 98AG31]|uniref:Uncharacterized protein n=1 Tax=Melampsora larici-populina (strain 98AG31 / pathotype 3-4-7) TaxID=747676 RepID=F4R986_MELLP|nr:uncharacterized protein MELLADRAFT_59908 [Melampsora larici-populina 98AG31]EGG11196.1 hypothetical protein MELLADRAFT_59908 [Melampsora larici-populina 98AG31]
MPRGSNTWYASDSKAANISRSKKNDEAQLYAYKIREAKRTFAQDKEDAKLHLSTTQRKLKHESDLANSQSINERLGQPPLEKQTQKYQTKSEIKQEQINSTTNKNPQQEQKGVVGIESNYRRYDDDRTLQRELEFERSLNHQLVLQNELLRLRESRHEEMFRSLESGYHARPSRTRLPSFSLHDSSYYDSLLGNLERYPVRGRYLEESYHRMI